MSEKMIVACPECRTRFVAPLEKFLPDGRKVRCAKCGHAWFQRAETDAGQEKPTAAEPTESLMDRATKAASGTSVIERAEQRRAELEASAEQAPEEPQDAAQEPVHETEAEIAAAPAIGTTIDQTQDTAYGVEPAMPEPASLSEKPRRGGFGRTLFYTAAAAIITGAAAYFFKDPLSRSVPSLAPQLASWHATVDGFISKVLPSQTPLRIENAKFNIEEVDDIKALLLSAEVVNQGDTPETAPRLMMKILGENNELLDTVTMATEDLSTEIGAGQRAPYFLRVPEPPEGLKRVEADFAK